MNAHVNSVTRAPETGALASAARAALRAPSVFNTQPWKWRVTGDVMQLSSDPRRRLGVADAEGRLLLLSCGGALHHALVVLAAQGWLATVERLPDERRPDLLARVRLTGRCVPDPAAERLAAAISLRHTDRRAFGERQPAPELLAELAAVAQAAGAALFEVPAELVPELAVAVDEAADVEYFDPAYRSELTRWTHRPAWTGDGVPPANAVRPSMRRVPVRNLFPSEIPSLLAGADEDEGAAYVILYGTGDRPLDLLRGGEAMSAVLLAATADGLATAPISEAVEVAWPRQLLRRLLPAGGEPFLIVRLGYVESDEVLPMSPRREAHDAIQIDD
ncbi:MAG TPA: nitroreductase [Actinoplanes sp.]|nr:nitroreductase [Actinoplanes sp.]